MPNKMKRKKKRRERKKKTKNICINYFETHQNHTFIALTANTRTHFPHKTYRSENYTIPKIKTNLEHTGC